MRKKELIKLASAAYPDGLVMACFEHPRKNFGDGLAKFIADELADTFEPRAANEKQIREALRVMEKARNELMAVCNALSDEIKKPEEMLDKHLYRRQFLPMDM